MLLEEDELGSALSFKCCGSDPDLTFPRKIVGGGRPRSLQNGPQNAILFRTNTSVVFSIPSWIESPPGLYQGEFGEGGINIEPSV